MQLSITISRSLLVVLSSMLASACSTILPTIGPSRGDIEKAQPAEQASIQVVEVDDAITRQLLAQRKRELFSETLARQTSVPDVMGTGDYLEVSIWEAAPATLFGTGSLDPRVPQSPSRATTLPEQPVDSDGTISVPFAGHVPAAGQSLTQIAAEIERRLKDKANQPEVLVRRTRNLSATVTVVGEVNASTRVPLSAAHERLLDALATAAGVRQAVSKMTIQVTRGSGVYSLPLETIIQDPRQNIPLQSGDVITALFQPFSFTALGATGKNDEIYFETQGISLAQALARSGGMIDQRSNATGVFIFRFEPEGALQWPRRPVTTTPDGTVPVVYRVNLTDPRSLFIIQSFPVHDRDILYVSNAPITEVQKALNIIFTLAYPIITAKQAGF